MGQYFVFANLDAQETTKGAGNKLGEDFWTSKKDIATLLMRYWSVDDTSMNIWTPRSSAILQAKSSAKAKILCLPNELIRAIFDEMDDLLSIVYLCVAHDILGLVGEALLRKLVVPEPCGPWAGHRIICVGDYCESDSFPPDIQDEVSAQLAKYAKMLDNPKYPPTFYGCVRDTYPCSAPQSQYYNLSRWNRKMSKEDNSKVWEIEWAMDRVRVSVDIEDPNLVLCNLTKGVYVRNYVVNGFHNLVAEEVRWADISLGTVLFSRICWSTDSSCAMHSDLAERLTQGDWAGDRFEIVPINKVQPDIEWKDVTDEAMAWLRKNAELDLGITWQV